MSLKAKRRLVGGVTHLGVLILLFTGNHVMTSSGRETAAGVLALGILLYAVFFRRLPIARIFQRMFIPEFTCPDCGWRGSLWGRFKCSCGFLPAGERHAFDPCSRCGKQYEWVECPACQTGIPIW